MRQAVIALLADADPGLALPNLLIRASDTGAGTPNAIQATTNLPVPAGDAGALVALNIFEENTGSPVTVAFNGGSALTIKSNSGNDIAAGGLAEGMVVLGVVIGSTFRLFSDQSSAAILAAAEAAQIAAEDAQAAAEAAAAGVNLPSILPGDAGKSLFVNEDEDGYELRPPSTALYPGVGDGATNDGPAINAALAQQAVTGAPVLLRSGKTYFTSEKIGLDDQSWSLSSDGPAPAVIRADQTSAQIIVDCNVPLAAQTTLSTSSNLRDDTLLVVDASSVLPGDILTLRSTKAWYTDPREDSALGGDAIGTAQSGGSTTIVFRRAILTLFQG